MDINKAKETIRFQQAVETIVANAKEHQHRRPAMTTLLEEFAEAVLAARGKHNDPLELEITQIGGTCINILWQLSTGHEEHVCNIGGRE